ncbi:MAG: DegT/DnrJ/EryC1/StrS family aminotransferase [Candidatus Thermoplasmatota archaeon]|jgi:perosamine synthetase|nr:DegT/DnrJ/EryC1/StrS family aminotransferase [Candidatus Thermoplasmatota archaeon]
MQVPWVIPDYQQQDIKAIKKVLQTKWYTMGPEVKKLEDKVSSYLHIKYAVAVNNGSSALDVAIKCLNFQKSDEVIIPALTYIATANAVTNNQGTPVFVDIDDTLNIDPTLIEENITEKTKAIMNIDFGGNVCDYSSLLHLCKKYNLHLLVDGAQSFGSQYKKKMCCTHGLINTTSFHAAKIITTIEGGMVFTAHKELFHKAQMIRNQGQSKRYIHPFFGNNYRMTDINAAMGRSQMDRVNDIIHHRMELARYYKDHLKNVTYPEEHASTKNSHLFFSILIDKREKLRKHLSKNGIETRIHYPYPINKQPIYYTSTIYPKATEVSQRILSIPIYHSLTQNAQDYVIKKINTFTKGI